MRRWRPKSRILLPGEKESRRGFLKKGLIGGLLLAAGGSGYLATRKTSPLAGGGKGLRVLSPEEAAVVLAIADRLIPERDGFPRPAAIDLPVKVDALVAMSHPAAQKEIRQLVRLFESALTGFLFEGVPQTFTASSPEAQDGRLAGWAASRVALRRTGSRALRRLVYAAYYSSPETHAALGYRGPPPIGPPVRHEGKEESREKAAESRTEGERAKAEVPRPATRRAKAAPPAEAERPPGPAAPAPGAETTPAPAESKPVEAKPPDSELVAPPAVEPPAPKEEP